MFNSIKIKLFAHIFLSMGEDFEGEILWVSVNFVVIWVLEGDTEEEGKSGREQREIACWLGRWRNEWISVDYLFCF